MGQALAIAAMAGGNILSAGAAHTQGQTASRMATMQAGQLDKYAGQVDEAAIEEQAKSQIKAKQARKDATLLQSRIIALAAAGGGGVNQKSVVNNLLEVQEKGEYNSLMELYNGSSSAYELRRKADQLRIQAIGTRFEGREARKAGNMAAIGSLLQTGGQMASFSSKFNTTSGGNTMSPTNQNLNTSGNVFAPYSSQNTQLTTSFR